MAMKVVFFFNQGQQGFSETYYFNVTQSPINFQSQITTQLIASLISWRHSTTVLYGYRITGLPVLQTGPAVPFVFPVVYAGKAISNPSQVPYLYYGPAVCSTSCEIRVNTGQGYSRKIYFRGLNTQDVIRDPNTGVNVPSSYLAGGIGQLIQNLISMQFAVQQLNKPPIGSDTFTYISSVTAGAAAGTSVLTCLSGPNPIPTNQQYINFTGIPTDLLPGFPKTAPVISTTVGPPATVTIPYLYRGATPVTVLNKLKFALLQYSYPNVSGSNFWRFSEHKTGRPFGVLPGRARAKVRRN